jgi:hypothetical protein
MVDFPYRAKKSLFGQQHSTNEELSHHSLFPKTLKFTVKKEA